MTKKICDSPIHKVSSLALAFIIFVFCVFPSFAYADEVEPSPSPSPVRPNPPIGYQDGDTFRDIMLVVFDSWGISFSSSSNSDTSILEYGDNLIQDYLNSVGQTQEYLFNSFKYGVDQLGNIILDWTGVNLLRDIANWFSQKYSLSDNNSIPVQEVNIPYSFVSIPYYSGNDSSGILRNGRILYISGNSYHTSWFLTTSFSSSPVYSAWVAPNYPSLSGASWYTFVLSPNSSAVTFAADAYGSSWNYTCVLSNRHGPFYYTSFNWGYPTDLLSYDGRHTEFPVFSSVDQFFSALDAVVQDIVVINTREIDIPSDNDISPNDGLKIEIPGTNWGDSIYSILDLIERLIVLYDNTQLEIISIIDTLENLLSNLQHSVTVENIPGAVILDYDDYDIPLQNDWGLFDIFFNTGGEEITLLRPWQELKSIIYGFPAPVLSFFALVVLFIVAYGFIRMGRDSH